MGISGPGSAAGLGLLSALGERTGWGGQCPLGLAALLPVQVASGVEEKGLALFLEEAVCH